MKIKKDINAREERVLNLLWDMNTPMTSNEMFEALSSEDWKQITLLKTVQSLTDKGYLNVAGIEKVVKTYARRFEPSISKGEYYSRLLNDKNFDDKNIIEIVAALLGENIGKKEDYEKIANRLSEIIKTLRSE